MMQVSGARVKELIKAMPWQDAGPVRVIWVHLSDSPRRAIAEQLRSDDGGEHLIPIIVREPLFQSGNAVLSDLNQLLNSNKSLFNGLVLGPSARITVVLLSKDAFSLAQIASPTVLPSWFPLLPGNEVFLRIVDLFAEAQDDLMSCPESRIDLVSELVFELERQIVARAALRIATNPSSVDAILAQVFDAKEQRLKPTEAIRNFERHLKLTLDPRAYRISAKLGDSFAGRLVRLAVRSSPDQLASVAKILAASLGTMSEIPLKPTLLSVLLRPTVRLDAAERSWHAILIAIYQAYQLTTAAAHAGEYARYPVSLISATSADLVRLLRIAIHSFQLSAVGLELGANCPDDP